MIRIDRILIGFCLMAVLACAYSPAIHAQQQPAAQSIEYAACWSNPELESTGVINSDLLLYAAIRDLAQSEGPLEKALMEIQRELLQQGRDALVKRFKIWKLDDAELRAALTELMLELAVMTRAYEPQREFLLSFEKSVQLRFTSFTRELMAGEWLPLVPLPPLQHMPDPGAMAQLYSLAHPLNMATEKGRLMALLWLHLLRTEPELKQLWQRRRALVELDDPSAFRDWNRLENSLHGQPLGRYSDLANPEVRQRMSAYWKPESTARDPNTPTASMDPLSLLPLHNHALHRELLILVDWGLQPSGELLAALASNDDTLDGANRYRFQAEPLQFEQASASFAALLKKARKQGDWLALLDNQDESTSMGLAANTALALWTQAQNVRLDVSNMADVSLPPWVEVNEPLYRNVAALLLARASRSFVMQQQDRRLVETLNARATQWAQYFQDLALLTADASVAATINLAPLPETLRSLSALKEAIAAPPSGRAVFSSTLARKGSATLFMIGEARWNCTSETAMQLVSQDGDGDGDDEIEQVRQQMLSLSVPRLNYLQEVMPLQSDLSLGQHRTHSKETTPSTTPSAQE